MSKRLTIIIVSLFIVQIGVYSITHFWESLKEEDEPLSNTPSLIEEFGDYETRETLYLNGRNYTQLPDEITRFKNLKYLHLENNRLTEFPYEVLSLNLHQLNLNGNLITEVDIENLKPASLTLKTLEIADNQLTEIKGLERFTKLSYLDLSYNGLIKLDCNNAQLEKINLSTNNFRTIPDLSLTNCSFIELSNNRIERLDFEKLPFSATEIKLVNNEISSIKGDSLIPAMNIEKLNLSQNAFELFPNNLLKINTLKELKLNQNLISVWSSEEFPVNSSIAKIELSFNDLLVVLADLDTLLPNLQSLYLDNNQLVSVEFNHDSLYNLLIQNNRNAVCNLSLPNLYALHCDYQHIETETRQVYVPQVREMKIYNSEGYAVSSEVLALYPSCSISYW